MVGDELKELREAVNSWEQRHDALVSNLINAINKKRDSSSQSTITVNAGGIGIWLSVSACAVMMAMNLALLAMVIRHDRKIDDLGHYLNAIYMIAPSLKPEDK